MPTFRFRHDVAAKVTNAAKKVDDKNPEDVKEKNPSSGATREKIVPGVEATIPESSGVVTAEPDNQNAFVAKGDQTETVTTEDTATTESEAIQQAVEPASDENTIDMKNPFADEISAPDQVAVEMISDIVVTESASTGDVAITDAAAPDFDNLFGDPLFVQTSEGLSSCELEPSITDENTGLVSELKTELMKELREELKDELRAEIKEELKAELKAKLKVELRSKLKNDSGTEES